MRRRLDERGPAGAVLGLALVGWLAGPLPARAQTNLQLELAELAKDIKKSLDGLSADSVTVVPFADSGQHHSSFGPGICQTLSEELTRLDCKVRAGAPYRVSGEYRDNTDPKTGRLVLKVTARLREVATDKERGQWNRGVFGEETVAGALGLTVALPPGGDAKSRTKLLEKAVDDKGPKAHIGGGRVSPADKNPYGLEVLVRKGKDRLEARKPQLDAAGFPHVEVKRDEAYVIRLFNDTDHEAAVTLMIDGINLFAFAGLADETTKRPVYPSLIVPRKSHIDVPGWPTDLRRGLTDDFVVTAYAKAAAAQLKSDAPVGVITACFAAAWPKGGKPPADEPNQAPEHSRSGDATGRGRTRTDVEYREVERVLGVVRAAVSVRYTR